MSPGLVQLAAVWCSGEPAEEDAVCAERCCSSAHQHTASSPHHSGFASTPLAASRQTSGVQDRMSGTPIDYVNSTDLPILPTFNSSLSMVDRSFAVAGPHVWNSLPVTVRQITRYGQFRRHLKTHLFMVSKSQRIVTLDYWCDTQILLLTYLLTYI